MRARSGPLSLPARQCAQAPLGAIWLDAAGLVLGLVVVGLELLASAWDREAGAAPAAVKSPA